MSADNKEIQNIGKKLRFFRKRAGLSQMQLELEVGASTGSVSRMENGEVNPSKETLSKVAKALNLSSQEFIYFTSHNDEDEYNQSIKRAIEKVNTTFNSIFFYGYLLDYRYRVVYLSKNIRLIAKLLGIKLDKVIGKDIREILFDKEYKLRGSLDPEYFDHIAIGVLARWLGSRDYLRSEEWFVDLENKLNKLPDYERLLKYVQDNHIDPYIEDYRTVSYRLLGAKVKGYYNFYQLIDDSDFTVIEFKFFGIDKLIKGKYQLIID